MDAVSLEEMYTIVVDKTLHLILPSYVGSGDSHSAFSSTSSTGRGSSNVQSLLQETLPAVVLQGDKKRVLNYFFLVDVNILLNLIIFLSIKEFGGILGFSLHIKLTDDFLPLTWHPLLLFPILWKVLLFFDNLYLPTSCQCGETVAVHPKMFLDHCKDMKRETYGVTEAAIRSFIKKQRIGCTSNRIRFRGSKVQVSTVHISREWFKEDVLKKLDDCE